MSIESDFNESGLSAKDYLQSVWDETELNEDSFGDLEDLNYLESDDIRKVLFEILEEREIGDTRKRFYQRLVLDFLNQENGAAVDQFCQTLTSLACSDDEKHGILARLFTRVLRGELAGREGHLFVADAQTILLQHGFDPWRARVDKLIQVDAVIR